MKSQPSVLKPIECVRCKAENPATAIHCLKCGMILDEKAALEITPLEERIQRLEKILTVVLTKEGLSKEAIDGMLRGELAKRVKKEYVSEH